MQPQAELDSHQDQEIADFTDRLLAGAPVETTNGLSEDGELNALKTTVRLLKRRISDKNPSPGMRERIYRKLALEWRAIRMKPEPWPVKRFLAGWFGDRKEWKSGMARQRSLAMRCGMAVMIVLAAAFFMAPFIENQMTGAALDGTHLVPLAIFAGLGLILILVFFKNR
jgi:hypothetical protein